MPHLGLAALSGQAPNIALQPPKVQGLRRLRVAGSLRPLNYPLLYPKSPLSKTKRVPLQGVLAWTRVHGFRISDFSVDGVWGWGLAVRFR